MSDRTQAEGGRSALPIHPDISRRFSPRAFSDRLVTGKELELLFEAARWAPSSMNEQPWRFVVVERGAPGHDGLVASLTGFNRQWADKAPVLILNLAVRSLSRSGETNHHAWHDLGLAVAQLTVQATSMGMGLHQLGGFELHLVKQTFSIPEGMDLVSIIALGFPGDPEQLPEPLLSRERNHSPRKDLSELVIPASALLARV